MNRLIAIALSCLVCAAATAQTPVAELVLHHDELVALQGSTLPTDQLSYQGELLDNGQPVEGPVDFQFRWWSAPVGGTSTGSVTVLAVPVAAGRFGLYVPATFPDGGQNVFMEVAVNRAQPPAFVVLGRQELVAAPFAVFSRRAGVAQTAQTAQTATTAQSAVSAQNATTAQNATSAQTAAFAQAPWLTGAGGIHYNNRVGVGTSTPATPLDLRVTGSDVTGLQVLHQGTASNPAAFCC